MRDYVDWHAEYDDPDSNHSRRLVVVQRRIGEALAALGDRAERALSLCSGDGRDVLPLVGRDVSVTLVEKDETLAGAARDRAAGLGLDSVEVVCGDAGDMAVVGPFVPVDLLLLCGIFGNVSEADIRGTVAAVPALVRPGGYVVWTRGRFEHDLRPVIRQWFVEEGLGEIAFDGEPETFGVGLSHRPEELPAGPLPSRLFTFIR